MQGTHNPILHIYNCHKVILENTLGEFHFFGAYTLHIYRCTQHIYVQIFAFYVHFLVTTLN